MALLYPEGSLGNEYIITAQQDDAGEINVGFYGIGPTMLAITGTVDEGLSTADSRNTIAKGRADCVSASAGDISIVWSSVARQLSGPATDS